MVLSYEIKEYLIPLVAMDAMAVAMFELQRISMIQFASKHTTNVFREMQASISPDS